MLLQFNIYLRYCGSRFFQIENQDGRLVIGLVDHSYTQQIAERVLLILMDQVDGSMKTGALCSQYSSIYGEELNVEEIVSHLPEYVQVRLCTVNASF